MERGGGEVGGGSLGGGSTSASEACLAAARWLRRALAAAPRLRRRRRPAAWFPGAGGEVEGVEAGLDVEDSASSSIANLMLDLPPLVEMVRLAVPPASSTL